MDLMLKSNRFTTFQSVATQEVTLESSMDIPSGQFSGRDFGYDAAGAVTRDVSRNIANIDYYFNGMPSIVGTMEGDCISYVYTADGEKLAETVWNGNRTTRRDYIGPFEFIGGQLLRINLPQGYIDSIGTLHAYIPDIQGNIVGVYEAREGNTELEQLNEYYAYGGLTADSKGHDANRRKHTAKELTTDLGINTYDFTARNQYPMASRFDQPDRLSYVKPWNSPYAFCGGDPINRTDPTGLNDYYNNNGNYLGSDGIDNNIVWFLPHDITKEKEKQINEYINSSDWDKVQEACVNTEATIVMLQQMLNSIGDNGKGGTRENNNREYGGTYDNDKVTATEPSDSGNPITTSEIGIKIPGNGHKYHSHPSGDDIVREWNQYGQETLINYGYIQSPSDTDIYNAKIDGNVTRIVFAMKDKIMYVYNGDGILGQIGIKALRKMIKK